MTHIRLQKQTEQEGELREGEPDLRLMKQADQAIMYKSEDRTGALPRIRSM
jgi:hypothetical protein